MWNASTIKKFTEIDPITAGEDQLVTALGKVITKGKRAEIGAAIIANFMERRGFTFTEAAERVGRSPSALKTSAARATVIMELPEADALAAWTHLEGMKDGDARALGESLALHLEDDRPGAFLDYAAARTVEDRCPTWSAEDQANASAHIVSRGMTTKDNMRRALLAYAEHNGLTLTVQKRTPDPDKDTAPTAARVATAATLFESDREKGSEGAEFEITDTEAADLVRAVQVAIRTLRRAKRTEDLDALGGFLAESIAMVEA